MNFVQVPLDVAATNSLKYHYFSPGFANTAKINSKYLSLAKAKHRFREEGILLQHITQSPIVISNFKAFIERCANTLKKTIGRYGNIF